MASYDDTATVSGSIVRVNDGADSVPLKNWLVTLPASLDGYSEVNAVRSGKNLLLPENADISQATVNGIDRSYSLDNREFTFSGTNTKTDASWLILNGSNWVIDGVKIGETYRFSHNLTADFYSQFTYNKSGGGVGALGYLAGNAGQNASVSLTIPNDFVSFARFQIGVRSTAGAVNIVAHFQLEVGSTPTQYTAYEAPTQYTASLGRTIYGGTADIVTGEGEDENGNAFTFTPITPTPETALGVNNFWSDQGNTELTYYKDGYGTTSITIHKETPEGEPVEETRKLHRIIYEGQVDVISGTGLIYRGESGTQYDPPEQISFTPIEVSTDEGENTLYADEGDSAITYRKAVE